MEMNVSQLTDHCRPICDRGTHGKPGMRFMQATIQPLSKHRTEHACTHIETPLLTRRHTHTNTHTHTHWARMHHSPQVVVNSDHFFEYDAGRTEASALPSHVACVNPNNMTARR